METIYDILKEEHYQITELFQQALQDKLKETFTKIKLRADPHMIGEEKLFYPLLEENTELRSLITKSYEEHNSARSVMIELKNMDDTDVNWTAKISELKQIIDHHIEEEEGKVFERARNILSQEEAEKLAEEYIEFKRSYMNRIETGATPV